MSINDVFENKKVWIAVLFAYPLLLILTMYKDYVVTNQMPNILFYVTVPEIGILGSCLAVVLLNRLTRHDIHILVVVKIVFISEFIFQIWEDIAKLIYYLVWKYPGFLWFIVFPVSFYLVTWLFHHVTRTSWRYSMILSIVSAIAGLIAGLAWISLTGIETFGS